MTKSPGILTPRRNTVHAKYPPELAKLVQLRGAITRQINKRTKEESTHEQ